MKKVLIIAGLTLLGWVMLPGTTWLVQKHLGEVKAGGGDAWRCHNLSTCRLSLQSDSGLYNLFSVASCALYFLRSRAVL